MLQKALKLEHGEAYFDVLNDLKYYENDSSQLGSKTYKLYAPYKDTTHFSSHLTMPPVWKRPACYTTGRRGIVSALQICGVRAGTAQRMKRCLISLILLPLVLLLVGCNSGEPQQ